MYPAKEDDALLQRTQRFLQFDAIAWAVRCTEDGDSAGLSEAVAYLAELRAEVSEGT